MQKKPAEKTQKNTVAAALGNSPHCTSTTRSRLGWKAGIRGSSQRTEKSQRLWVRLEARESTGVEGANIVNKFLNRSLFSPIS